MKVFWEEELVYNNYRRGENTLVFTSNLKMFMFNHKEINFIKIFPEDASGKDYFEAKSEGVIYRHVHGIESKEDLVAWYEMLKADCPNYSYYNMNINTAHLSFNWAKRTFRYEDKKSLLDPQYKELCSNNEELYNAFKSTYFNGYFFNNCKPNVVYKNVYSYDFKSNHSAIMFYEKFPTKFTIIAPKHADKLIKEKKSFYGHFTIYFKNHADYLRQFAHRYNESKKQMTGYFNNIDIEFFEKLCGIQAIDCDKLWEVELDFISKKLRKAIKRLFLLKETLPKGIERDRVKLALEKIYGNCAKRRTYNEEATWEDVNEELHHNFEYSIGVWTVSYCRLRLLTIQKAIGKDAIYGDIDSIKFCNKKNCAIIDKVNKGIDKNFPLGLLSFEYCAREFKALSQKTYCAATDKGLQIACAGANKEIVQSYFESLDEPVKNFSRDFPPEIKPYKTVVIENDKMVYKWVSSADTATIIL